MGSLYRNGRVRSYIMILLVIAALLIAAPVKKVITRGVNDRINGFTKLLHDTTGLSISYEKLSPSFIFFVQWFIRTYFSIYHSIKRFTYFVAAIHDKNVHVIINRVKCCICKVASAIAAPLRNKTIISDPATIHALKISNAICSNYLIRNAASSRVANE